MKRFALLALLASTSAFAANDLWNRSRGIVRFVVEGPLDDVTGESRTVIGSINFTPENPTKLSGGIGVDLATLRTGIDQRDRDMRDEFFQVARFPKAYLIVDSLEKPSAATLAPGSSITGELKGSFEVHGVRRSVRVPVTLKLDAEGKLRATGRFSVPFSDFAISRPQRLFLKLGDTANVWFDMGFERVPEKKSEVDPVVVVAPTVTEVQAPVAPPKPKPPRKPKPALVFTYLFKGDDDKARGEKLFHSPTTGGEGNKMTCYHCHAKTNERDGLALKGDGHIRPANTLYDSAQRPKFWNGFAPTVGKAASICQKQYMLGDGLSEEQDAQLTAFLTAISPNTAAELDYRTTYRSMEQLLSDPTGGDAAKGKKKADTYCMTCHLDGRVGPVWAPGLYEPDWVVRRVRRGDGHKNKQMPNFTFTRLPDEDLRDIVTYLTAPSSAAPIFERKK
ncbi:MAG: hypothetical protein DI536_30925 [Archangium gephyra]|uniref:Cytochrome c domain-containing protein n=1 Tax=Archangium gephyra TaxID=48 RepID=A0A2W5V7F9_9BACT|nr:MAG: hypothetical protein DI536_30925 [Archangium gephyra]